MTNPFPTNPDLQKLFPDHYDPPASDGGDVKPFWYSFDLGHNKVSDGGWARQVTVKDLPVSTTIAGVNMRLNKGAIREAHWHVAAEWAYMLSGQCRVSVVAPDGKGYAADVGPGDLWYFPSGHPHTLQGIGDDGCEFLIVFDNGSASEFDTFLITDWMHHTPREVLAKNFGLPTSIFDPVPSKELYIFSSDLPGPLAQDKTDIYGADGETPEPFTYRMLAGPPDVQGKSGEVRIVDSTKFKVSTTVAAAHVKLRPGGLRELHWHTEPGRVAVLRRRPGLRMTVFNGNLVASRDARLDVSWRTPVRQPSGHHPGQRSPTTSRTIVDTDIWCSSTIFPSRRSYLGRDRMEPVSARSGRRGHWVMAHRGGVSRSATCSSTAAANRSSCRPT